MLIAQNKRKSNIAEYILYMWQVEDILRALELDVDKINSQLVARFQAEDDLQLEIQKWYENLAVMMQKEQVVQKGHLQFITNQLNDLYQFHLSLLQSPKDTQYALLFQMANPVLDEFRQKSHTENDHEIYVGLHALYSVMLLNLQKKEVSVQTRQAITHISKFIAHLSARYLQYEKGKFEL